MSENRITQEKALTVKIIFNSQHKTEELKAFRILRLLCFLFNLRSQSPSSPSFHPRPCCTMTVQFWRTIMQLQRGISSCPGQSIIS